MNCADAAERITALVDGELPPEERAELERHLAECGACRDARAAEEAIAARVRGLGRPPLPDGFRDAVLERVRAEPAPGAARPPGRIIPLGPWLTAGAAAAAAALAMVYFGGGDRAGAPVAYAPAEKRAPALEDANLPERAAEFASRRVGQDKGAEAGDGALAASRGEAKPQQPDQTGGGPPPEPAPTPTTAAPAAGPPPPPKSPAPGAPAPATPPAARRPAAPAGGGGAGGKDGAGGRAGGSETPPADEGKKKRANESGLAEAEEERKEAPSEDDSLARVKSEEVEKTRKRADGDRDVRRLALFFRAPGGPSAERDIDRVLLAHRELALETVGWKDASTLDTASGRALKEFTEARDREAGGFAQMEAAKAPVGRVIQVRLRARDLDRVREALGKAESVREAGSLLLLDIESRDLGEVERGALAGLVSPPAPDAEAKPGAAAPPASAGGTPAPAPKPTPAPAEPEPPPPPSGKALEKLARGVEPPPRPVTDPAKADGEAEVWLEIHLLGEPSPR